jgi:parallel beta helix pectate lyase-like protein
MPQNRPGTGSPYPPSFGQRSSGRHRQGRPVATIDREHRPGPLPPSPPPPRRRVRIRPWAVAAGLVVTLSGAGIVALLDSEPRPVAATAEIGSATNPRTSQRGTMDTAEANDFTPQAPARTTGAGDSRYGAATIGSTRYSIPAGARFVSPAGNNSNAGTSGSPWRTLAHAASRTPAGGTIVLRRGVYHEYVQIYGKKLHLQSYPGESVWFDGSRPVTGWVRDGSAWRVDGWTAKFDNSDPTASNPNPNWNMVDPRYPMSRFPDQVFINGKQLEQVGSRAQLRTGAFFVDYAAKRLYLGSDPTGAKVEATRLAEALYLNRANGSTVRGIGFRRYATPLLRYGAVKGFADDLVFENVVVADTATTGLQVNGTNVTVRRSTVVRNGRLGIAGYKAPRLRLIGNAIDNNNTERFRLAPEAGGVKVTSSATVQVTGNRAEGNLGTGIWIDQYVTDAVIARNLARRNTGHGIHFEISDGALITGNVVADNLRSGIKINEAGHARIWNNTVLGVHQRQIELVDGPRRGTGRLTLDVHDIEIRNNLLDGPAGRELLGVEDFTQRRDAGAMASPDGNAYYRPAGSQPLIHWVDRRLGTWKIMSLAEFRRRTGKEAHGISANTPAPFSDRARGRLQPGSAPTAGGLPIPADVARLLGLTAGARPGIGAPVS